MNCKRLRVGFFFFGGVLRKAGPLYYTRSSIFNMLRHLSRFWDVTFVFPEIKDDGVAGEGYAIDLGGAETRSVPGWTSGVDLYVRKLPRILLNVLRAIDECGKRWDIAVICDTDLLSQITMLFAKLRGLPVVFYVRGNPEIEILKRNKSGIRGILARLWCAYLERGLPILFSYSAVIVTGSRLLSKFRDVGRIHPFVSTAFTEEALPKPDPSRDYASVPLRAIFVGNVIAQKGVDIALRAIRAAKNQGVQIRLDVVGAGPFLPACKQVAHDLEISDRVFFHGFVPFGEGLFEIYRLSHVFLLPSLSEGTPKVVVEAMAFGLPIIASRVGGIPDLVGEGETGFMTEPGDSASVAAGLANLASDRQLLRRMSGSCFAVVSQLTLETQVGALTKFLRALSIDRVDRPPAGINDNGSGCAVTLEEKR